MRAVVLRDGRLDAAVFRIVNALASLPAGAR
jgi:hypothetical protein